MIDIHAHILPGVDDGSESMAMSLGMLRLSAECGVTDIAATPHCNIPGEYENYVTPELGAAFRRLCEEVKRAGIPVNLIRGMEVYVTEEVPELIRRRQVGTLNDTNYLLVEFAFDEDPYFCLRMLHRIRELGIRPVIAHPERYFFVQDDPAIAYDWCTSGYALQLNKGSLLGSFGPGPERTARLLVEHGLCAMVASDAHSDYRRTPHMGEVRRFLESEFGREFSELLLEINPRRILQGQGLLGYEPIPF